MFGDLHRRDGHHALRPCRAHGWRADRAGPTADGPAPSLTRRLSRGHGGSHRRHVQRLGAEQRAGAAVHALRLRGGLIMIYTFSNQQPLNATGDSTSTRALDLQAVGAPSLACTSAPVRTRSSWSAGAVPGAAGDLARRRGLGHPQAPHASARARRDRRWLGAHDGDHAGAGQVGFRASGLSGDLGDRARTHQRDRRCAAGESLRV